MGRILKLYFLHFSGQRLASLVSVALCVQADAATALQCAFQVSTGTSLQSVGFLSPPTLPYWQYFFPDLIALNFRKAVLFGLATGG